MRENRSLTVPPIAIITLIILGIGFCILANLSREYKEINMFSSILFLLFGTLSLISALMLFLTSTRQNKEKKE